MVEEELQQEEEIESYVEFRPTLVIGLGGTGHEVLVRLKAQFIETFGEEIFRVVKLRAFDTADESFAVPTEAGKQIRLDKDSELINIGHVPVQGIIRNIDRSPAVKAWLPENLPVRAITAGAKMIRPLGRLALFYHYDHDAKVRDRLQAVIRSLANIKLKGAVGEGAQVARTRGVNVFIVCSLCGGTGSGIFIDMAYLVRRLLENSGIRQEYCYVNGILVLPQAFAMVASDAIMANAYAALRELNYYTREGGFHVDYPDGMRVEIHNRPFNICYLVDAVNENGKMLTGMEDLSPMIAESIFLQIGSQVGRATESVFDNVKSLDGIDNNEPTAFSSLGTASLVFPARRIIQTCALRFGQQLIRDGVLQESTSNPDQQAQEFIEKAQLLPEPLLLGLTRSAKGQPIQIKLQATDLGKIKTEEVVRDTERFLQMYETRRLNGDFRKLMDQNLEEMQTRLGRYLGQEAVRLTDDPAYGPRFTAAFLELLSRRLKSLMAGFDRERRQISEQLNRQKKAQVALHDALKNAASSFAVGRRRRVSKARDEYVEARERHLAGQFEVRKRNLAISLLSQLRATASDLQKQVQTLIDRFAAIEERFLHEAHELEEESGQMRFILASDISTLADVDRYYNQYAREVSREYTRFLDRSGSLYELGLGREDEVSNSVFDFARELFQPISEESLEAIVREKREQVRPEMRLEDLREDSVPFWNYDVTRMVSGGDLESLRVIGVEDKNKSLYRDLVRRGETLISTLDPHRTTVLHSKHGLPTFALEQMEFYKTKYEDHIRRQISPLHLFPDLPWLEGEEISRQWFALGQAFDFVERVGVWYYCLPRNEVERESGKRIRLAQGMIPSLNCFVHDPALVEDISQMVEDKIREIGDVRAMEVLDAYLARPMSRDTEVAGLELELKKLADKFKQQMESG
jgi:hypothetical protein